MLLPDFQIVKKLSDSHKPKPSPYTGEVARRKS